ncbi:uncharacterized protein LOC106084127 [Stomoxys calcitrans]|uniref:uncharacterized protein LOC106084127 n=1 Tax=Stomoxys calcitrans TaxID=35570 RepID=UPI0027E34CF9|nr:uncharacterized protein LOC106084127 [Stomoxys calcitrans]
MSFEVNSRQNSSTRNAQSPQLQMQQAAGRHQAQQQELAQVANTQQQSSLMSASPALPLVRQEEAMVNLNHNLVFTSNTHQQLSAAVATPTITENSHLDLMMVENVMPGIYLTKNFISWKREQLRTHGFTHVIIIDKHIQELYYPNQQPDIFKLCPSTKYAAAAATKRNSIANDGIHDDSSSINEFIDYQNSTMPGAALNFDKEFEVIDLNFGEKSYLTTVLPNCYRAVKFIKKALQSGGTILVIDCNGGEQKCLTIIVAYLMYKDNISFSNAFARLKEFYKKADLDRFYISQLYEYEPILQVQRAQSRGHSCSRELHAAILKRKKTHEEEDTLDNNNPSANYLSAYPNASTLFDNCNPLNQFDTTQMGFKIPNNDCNANAVMANCNSAASSGLTFTHFMSGARTGGWYNWEDYAME